MKIQSLRTDDCIDEVINKYSELVYRLAYARVYSKSDADDIFQEVFLRYVRKNLEFESEEHTDMRNIKDIPSLNSGMVI